MFSWIGGILDSLFGILWSLIKLFGFFVIIIIILLAIIL